MKPIYMLGVFLIIAFYYEVIILQIHLSKLTPIVNAVYYHTIVLHQRAISELKRQYITQSKLTVFQQERLPLFYRGRN